MDPRKKAKFTLTDAVEGVSVREKISSKKDTTALFKSASTTMTRALKAAYVENASLLDDVKKMAKVMAELKGKNQPVKSTDFPKEASSVLTPEKIDKERTALYTKIKARLTDQKKALETGLKAGDELDSSASHMRRARKN